MLQEKAALRIRDGAKRACRASSLQCRDAVTLRIADNLESACFEIPRQACRHNYSAQIFRKWSDDVGTAACHERVGGCDIRRRSGIRQENPTQLPLLDKPRHHSFARSQERSAWSER